MQVELGRAPAGDVERLDVRVGAPHADPGRLAGLVQQAAQSSEAIEQEQIVVGVAGHAGDLGNTTRSVLLQAHAAQCIGKDLDPDAVPAAHHGPPSISASPGSSG